MKERKQAVIGIQKEGKVVFTFLFQFSNKDMVIFLFCFFHTYSYMCMSSITMISPFSPLSDRPVVRERIRKGMLSVFKLGIMKREGLIDMKEFGEYTGKSKK